MLKKILPEGQPRCQPSGKFFVYILRRPDKKDPSEPEKDCPFYVGKGSKRRIQRHRQDAIGLLHKSGRKNLKITIIHKLWKNDLDFAVDICTDILTEKQAFEIECRLIKQYGRKDNNTGILANLTDGGDGTSGGIKTAEHRRKLSESQKGEKNFWYGKQVPWELVERRKKANEGYKHSPESCQKISKNTKGKKKNYSAEVLEKLSTIRKGKSPWKGRKHTIESRQKMSAARQGEKNCRFGKHHSEETKRKMSESQKGKIRSPEQCKKISEANKGRIVPDEQRKKISEGLKGRKLSTEHRHRISEARKIYWKNKREDAVQ